jgi:hypothetical protein
MTAAEFEQWVGAHPSQVGVVDFRRAGITLATAQLAAVAAITINYTAAVAAELNVHVGVDNERVLAHVVATAKTVSAPRAGENEELVNKRRVVWRRAGNKTTLAVTIDGRSVEVNTAVTVAETVGRD